jgi:hypothetical protein
VQCQPQGVYRPRNAQASPRYRLVEDHFDELERVWDERYERQYGFWRPVVRHVVEQFLDCGDLRCGFARLWCPTCRKDLVLPYSCRRRCFCPSCHQKRALLFAERIDEEVLGDLPVRQYVVTIPKMLRLCFKYDRDLLGLLSQCFYASVKELFQDAAGDCHALPGMIASLPSYGDDPTRFHPHLHSLVTDGLVSADGSLVPILCPDPVCLMELFRHKLIRALLAREKISPHLVEIMQNWVHPGFSVCQGQAIAPDDHEARRRLAGYMVHPPIALERLRYRPETRQVIYYGRQRGRAGPHLPGARLPGRLVHPHPGFGTAAGQVLRSFFQCAPGIGSGSGFRSSSRPATAAPGRFRQRRGVRPRPQALLGAVD